MPFSMPESMPVSLNEVLRSDKSKHNISGESAGDSPLKRAIKENEHLVIQSIVALQQLQSLHATNNNKKNSSSGSVETPGTGDSDEEGLSSLLDYLFEDGQLTRIEYDKVDKCYGINSATEQAQVLLRLLLNSKDDGALGILLEWLRKVDPKSETLRKLSSNLFPEKQANEIRVVFNNENETEFIILGQSNGSTKQKQHDFYYGRRQDDAIIGERLYDLQNCKSESNNTLTLSFSDNKRRERQQKRTGTDNKTKASSDPIDLRDFYLTNGCLETLRNLILYNCHEALSVPGWEKVLRNMNGLLSLDALSIKDLLCQIKTMDHQRAKEEETRIAKMVRAIYRERRELQQPNNSLEIQKPTGNTHHKPAGEKEINNQNENVFQQSSNQERTNEFHQSSTKYKYGSSAKWKQIIYRTLRLWKQRNGSYSTFYSLIGILQHSNLYQTADFLLERKKEIQSRENENDVDEGNINDVNTGTKPTFATYQ